MPGQIPSPGNTLSKKFDNLLAVFSKQNKIYSTALAQMQITLNGVSSATIDRITAGLASIDSALTTINGKEDTSNKTSDIATNSTSDIRYPSAKGVVSYVTSLLNNYATTSSLSAYVQTATLDSTLSGYLSTVLSNYVTNTTLANTLRNYVTTSALSAYETSANLATTLTDYVTNSSLANTLTGYVSNSTLLDYVTNTSLATTLTDYVTTTALSAYETTTALANTLLDYVTNSSLTDTLSNYVSNTSLTSTLSSYATVNQLTLAISGYVTQIALNTTLAAYETTASITATLLGYVTNTSLASTISNLNLGTASTHAASDFDPAGSAATALTDAKGYTDTMTVGLISDRGSWDASGTVNPPGGYPTTNGSGVAGAIMKGNLWFISTPGTLGTTAVTVGTSVRALVDNPGQTATNWDIISTTLGFSPEDVANKSTSVATDQASNTKYPSVKAVYDWVMGLTQPYYIAGFYPGTVALNALVSLHVFDAAVTIPASFTNSRAYCVTPATGTIVFDIRKFNGTTEVSVGSLTFNAGSATGVFSSSGAISCATGDVLKIVAPNSSDTTLADIGFNIAGTR